MAKLSHTDSRRMYSWWWDSHISPKNSKWLQENLTGMDAKVKAMIKLIEEDADSFAKRAEMYYKKRPELMKMVEEFYRAYRSLAERYDHATGVIRHAHRTMTEAFPNQAPLIFADDSLANSVSETDTRTPELATPVCVLGEDGDMRKKALKQFNDPFGAVVRVRKGLNFDEAVHNNHVKEVKLSKPDQECESEEIIILKEGLAKLEAEKEAGLVSYQQSLDRLSELDSEITQTREDFRLLSNKATKAENEVVVLKEALTKLETEKESTLQEYQRCLDRIAELQNIISTSEEDAQKFKERALSAETELQSLKGQLDKLIVEKDASLNQYMESLEMISNLESKLRLTDEDALRLKERAESAERDIETLKQTISKLTEEKEAAALQYQQCLETISSLERKLTCAQDEAKHLNVEIDSGLSKLKDAEEKCLILERSNLSLHSQLDSLMLKMGTQDQELTDKQKELGRLWACVQEERLRFVEAETAFQTLQHLHAQTQEEVRGMASELQNKAQLLKVAEIRDQGLEYEALRFKEENKHLDELNASYALSIKDLRNEISSLKESKGKLVEEVDLRLDQRNALQQEIYCLKEELNDLNMEHHSVLDEVLRVGLNPESLGSSVKELQDENFNLKETCRRGSSDKAALLEKLKILEQLLVKNSSLETSLSDLSVELKAVRGKIEALEQSCKSLLEEKSTLLDDKATLMTQLQETNKNLEKLSENNNVLVNLLSDTRFQLEAFKAKSKILEDSCQLLVNEKAGLITENDGLTFQLENTQIRIEDLRKIYGELESRCITLEEEKELTSHKVEELQMYLEVEREEHTDYIQMSEARFSVIEAERLLLHEECHWRRRELDQMLEKAINNEIEIFVLRITAQVMEENNCTLLIKNQKLLEESSMSEKSISELEQHKFEQAVETKSLSDQVISLRAGTCQLLKVLDIVQNHSCKDKTEQDQIYANMLLIKLQKMKESLCEAEKENQQLRIELSALIAWIRLPRLEAQNLEEKNSIKHEFKFRAEQLLVLQTEVLEILEMNEKLRSRVRDGDVNKEALILQIEDLNRELIHMQSTCQLLRREKLKILEEKRSLMNNYLQLEENKHVLEEENDALWGKVLALDNFSLVFKSCVDEKFTALRELGDNLNRLCDGNSALAEKLSLAEERLEGSKTETCHLKERLQRLENELKVVVTVKDQLINEIQSGKTMLHQMEIQLQEAEQRISLVEQEKLDLDKTVEDLRVEYSDVKKVRDFQQIQILKLSADNDHLSRENNSLLEARQMLEVELYELDGENSKIKRQEDTLHIDLQKKKNEINNLETQSASIFGQLQYSMVSQLLYEQKFHELHEACLGYINQNEDLKTQLAAYGPEIVSLKECILSLENHTDLHIKFQNPENEELQGAHVINDPTGSYQSEDKKTLMADTFVDLRDLRARLQAIEKAAVEIKELMVQENVDLRFKLDASMRQVELLKSESGRYRRSWKPTSEISEADNTLLTKDIVLDQISDGSSYRFSKREPVDMENQIIELWETSDPDGTIGLTVGKSKKVGSPLTLNKTDLHRVKSMKKQKGEFPTSGTQIEKELSVDKLEISKRYPEPLQEGNKRKVLERLDSDVQKLANLQITVQDLKRKLEVTEKGKRGKAVIECEALKTQLEEADMAVMKLFALNSRLMKSIENSTLKSSADPEGDGSARRRRIPEQARRMSEKIGRLQLEVQKLQFVLLKLDDEKEAKTKISETKRRIILRDYLYGAGRTGQKQKKAQFCACVQPPSSSD